MIEHQPATRPTSRRTDPAFDEVYREHHDHLVRLAQRWVFDDTAEHIVQDVLLSHWEQPSRFDAARGSLRTFLRLNCRHRAIDALRSDTARRRRDLAFGGQAASSAPPTPDHEGDRVVAALRTLPQLQREAIAWAFYGDLTYREVATRVGANESTVKSRIRTGLHTLRASLGPLPIAT